MSLRERLFLLPPEVRWLERRATRQVTVLALLAVALFVSILLATGDGTTALAAVVPFMGGFAGMAFRYAREVDRMRAQQDAGRQPNAG